MPRYRNTYPHARHGLRDFLRFLRGFQRQRWRPVEFPQAPNDPAFLQGNRTASTLTWVGHDTFLLQLGGLNVLTDPHFSGRASPLSWAGPARLVPPGLPLEALPPLDLVLVSHDHYDHLDDRSIRALARRHPQALFAAPSGLAGWLRRRGVRQAQELGWWQSLERTGFRLTAVPVQHFSGRGLRDRNRTLWCGFVLEAAGRRVFFAGDSGYSRDFADIAARFAPVDLALLPIGAYDPRWFMAAMHVDPEEAVRIHQDLRSRLSVAMHWGTFRLTEEPLDEPPRRLAAGLAAAGVAQDRFWVLRHGETRVLDAAFAAASGAGR